jgi:uncharacterized protein (DUF2062 family)
VLPFMPAIYMYEYEIGYWLLSNPHRWPKHVSKILLNWHEWRSWAFFQIIGGPLLVGSIVLAAPLAIASFFLSKGIVTRHQRKKAALASVHEATPEGPK